jgi:hypothetical protein
VIVRLLTLAAVMAVAGSPEQPEPKPLQGMPLTGKTGLRLLVANNPPLVLDVDTGRTTGITGLNVRGKPVLSVIAVGRDAVVWLYRRTSSKPVAEIYVLRSGKTRAVRLASAWEVAPAADGLAVWLKSFGRAQRCDLRELMLDGRQRTKRQAIPCSTRLVDSGSGALLVQRRSVVDPRTRRTLLRRAGVWARSGDFALTSAGSRRPLTLWDLRGGGSWALPWPSRIGGRDEAAVHSRTGLVALAFSDPAYERGPAQVTDLWLLHPPSRQFQHLPDMPAAVSLKFTACSGRATVGW